MIVRRTKIQLLVFALVTLLGGTFVGGRYAQVDRLVLSRTYAVDVQLEDSGGIFQGAQVTYRGIQVGRVGSLRFTEDGVTMRLDLEKGATKVPADTRAVVSTKSAIGEQFVDLQPRSDGAPYLAGGDVIRTPDTAIPLSSTELLVDVDDLVSSVDTDSLRTVVSELGTAFGGTGDDLGRILDTSSEFVAAADEHIDVTRALIRDSASVLQTQIDKRSDVATFSANLALLSDTLADRDPDLRRLLDHGAQSARTVDATVRENATDLGRIIGDTLTAQRPLLDNLAGLQTVFVMYPWMLQTSFSVLTPAGNEWNAAFGLVLTPNDSCTYAQDGGSASGYRQRRVESEIGDVAFGTEVDCKLPDNSIARQASKTRFR